MRRTVAVLALALCVAAGTAQAAGRATVTVYAAASLTDALPRIQPSARYQFAGSDQLAAQIGQGAPADVFAAAGTALPAALHRKGLCSKPVVFARNAIVVVVPRSNPAKVRTVYDLRRHGVKLVIAGPAVPVGGYTLQVLRALHLTSVLKNVVSRETDVRGVLAKVALGEADAGFVYSTDARTVPGKVAVRRIPAWAQPKVQYAMCVVAASGDKPAARAFVSRVVGRAGQRVLASDGFLPRKKKQ